MTGSGMSEKTAPRRANAPHAFPALDEGFIRRVCWMTALVALLVASVVGDRWGWRPGAGVLAGAALSIASLAALGWIVRSFVRREEDAADRANSRNRARLQVALLAKFPLTIAAVGLVVWLARADLATLAGVAGGVTLVPAVIFLKALGRALALPGEGVERNSG